MNNILIVTDNLFLAKWLFNYIKDIKFNSYNFIFVNSIESEVLFENSGINIKSLDINENVAYILKNFSLVISLHCKQFFKKELVSNIKCINVHPGYNPYNRGWYPQVFAIINNSFSGATIHEIDSKLDHGNIIDREKIEIFSWDTSLTVYNRVLDLEIKLLEKNLLNIIQNNYKTFKPENNGFFSSKNDFNKLCEINLDEKADYKKVINHLRALSHGNFKNAFFVDEKTGKKVYISINLETEE